MKPGIALRALTTSATIFLCLSALGAVDADSDVPFGAELMPSRSLRPHLSLGYKTANLDSESSLPAIAIVDITHEMNTRAATTVKGDICQECLLQ